MNTEETHPHPADHQPQQVRVITYGWGDTNENCTEVVEMAVTLADFIADYFGSDAYRVDFINDDGAEVWNEDGYEVVYFDANVVTIRTADTLRKPATV
jgi:hypothetical protein